MENLRQLDVVVLAARAVAQLTEFEPGHVVAGQARADLAVLDHQRLVALGLGTVRGQGLEAARHLLLDLFAERPVEQLGLLQRAQAIVDAAIDVDDLGMFLEQGDRRQETGALQAVLVQAVRHDVGGRHQAHAVLEQLFQQGGEDHRIGDVGDEELVEADHPRLVGEALADDGQRVLLALEGLQSSCTRFMKRWKCVRTFCSNGSDSKKVSTR